MGLGLAFVLGTIAQRFKLPPLIGYLLAGVAVGPFTPGFVADTGLTLQLADIGVILLMFGVGHLMGLGANRVVMGEEEIANAMLHFAPE